MAAQQSRPESRRLQYLGRQQRVYESRVNNVDELKQRLRDVWHGVHCAVTKASRSRTYSPSRLLYAYSLLPSDTDFTCINRFKRRLARINLNI